MLQGLSHLDNRFLSQFFDMVYCLEYNHGVTLTGYSYSSKHASHKFILKGRRKNRPVVAFLVAPSYTELLLHVGEMVDTDAITWFPDKYA